MAPRPVDPAIALRVRATFLARDLTAEARRAVEQAPARCGNIEAAYANKEPVSTLTMRHHRLRQWSPSKANRLARVEIGRAMRRAGAQWSQIAYHLQLNSAQGAQRFVRQYPPLEPANPDPATLCRSHGGPHGDPGSPETCPWCLYLHGE
jgi:hypothetical protein